MNKREYILNQLSQECVEVCKEISKALAFGLYDFNPNESPSVSNRDKIESELNDLLGAIDYAIQEKCLDSRKIFSKAGRKRKLGKIFFWMKHAEDIGALKDD